MPRLVLAARRGWGGRKTQWGGSSSLQEDENIPADGVMRMLVFDGGEWSYWHSTEKETGSSKKLTLTHRRRRKYIIKPCKLLTIWSPHWCSVTHWSTSQARTANSESPVNNLAYIYTSLTEHPLAQAMLISQCLNLTCTSIIAIYNGHCWLSSTIQSVLQCSAEPEAPAVTSNTDSSARGHKCPRQHTTVTMSDRWCDTLWIMSSHYTSVCGFDLFVIFL